MSASTLAPTGFQYKQVYPLHSCECVSVPHESHVFDSTLHGLRAQVSVDQGWWSTIRFANHPEEEVSVLPTICFGVWTGCVNITRDEVSTTKNENHSSWAYSHCSFFV